MYPGCNRNNGDRHTVFPRNKNYRFSIIKIDFNVLQYVYEYVGVIYLIQRWRNHIHHIGGVFQVYVYEEKIDKNFNSEMNLLTYIERVG